jgi:hypothetical protein
MFVTRTLKSATNFLILRASPSRNSAVSLALKNCFNAVFRSCLTRSSKCSTSALCLGELLDALVCAIVTALNQRSA